MNPVRRRRLTVIAFLAVGGSVTLVLALVSLQANIEFFYLPNQIVNGEAPVETRIRAGGMVLPGSVTHAEEELEVTFRLSDLEGSSFDVIYAGLLPALFKEGQGTVVTGTLREDGVFVAAEVLAKHDENYMPPELEGVLHERDT